MNCYYRSWLGRVGPYCHSDAFGADVNGVELVCVEQQCEYAVASSLFPERVSKLGVRDKNRK